MNDMSLFRFTFLAIRKYTFSFAIFSVFVMVNALEFSVIPNVLGNIVDSLSGYSGDKKLAWNTVGKDVVLYIFLWAVLHLGCRIAGFARAAFFPKFTAYIRMKTFEHLEQLSLEYFVKNFSGDISGKVFMLSEKLMSLIDSIIGLICPSLLCLIIASFLIFEMKFEMFIALISWFIIHMYICFALGGKCIDYEEDHAKKTNILNGRLVDSIVNNLVSRLFANEEFEYSTVLNYQKSEQVSFGKSLRYAQTLLSISSFLTVLCGIFGINLLGYYYWQHGYISIGELVFAANVTIGIVILSLHIGLELPQIFSSIGSCKQAFTIIAQKRTVYDISRAAEMIVKHGDIEFKNVSFSFDGKKLLNNVSLKISAKQKIGIVGYSGVGKTTFCNLILRLYDPDSGEILIDGQNISAVTQCSLRKSIAVVPQEPMLFHRSILENIQYGNVDSSIDDVIDAAKKAGAHEFIEKFPEKYLTNVGEFGSKISRGQQQRIAIARAILKNSNILILDEVTSGLDSISEKIVQQSLDKMLQNKTALIVAHRLVTLQNMDRILVFENGAIVEDGSHNVLIENKSGLYYKMWQASNHATVE